MKFQEKYLLFYCLSFDESDPILKFSTEWVYDLLNYGYNVIVIATKIGEYTPDKRLNVIGIRKKKRNPPLELLSFYYYTILTCFRYKPMIFSHMNILFLALCMPFAKMRRLKTGAWYAHSKVSRILAFVNINSNFVVTSTPLGNRIPTKNIHIIGQGIDISIFNNLIDIKTKLNSKIKLIHIGRISPSKDIFNLCKKLSSTKVKNIVCNVTFIGAPLLKSDYLYYGKIKRRFEDEISSGYLSFLGKIDNISAINYLNDYVIFIHLGKTGSLDKVVVEAILANCIVLSSNSSWKEEIRNIVGNEIFRLKTTGDDIFEKIEFIIRNKEYAISCFDSIKAYFIKNHTKKQQRLKFFSLLRKL